MKKMSKHKSRRFLVILMLAVITICMLMLAGCQTPDKSREPSETSRLEEIRERGVLKVGTTGDYQPMSYLDPGTGEYVGFDTELTEDLAGKLDVDIEYMETSWPTLMNDVLAGKFDLAICGITINDARKEQALM